MIKVSVLYPNTEGSRFDREYYQTTHIALLKEKTGEALKGVTIDYGLGGAAPGSKPPYVAVANILFDSLESMFHSFAPHIPTFQADVPNYTDVEPIVQISEVKNF
jgi:uncharacterized protein (TIGR02118 family)